MTTQQTERDALRKLAESATPGEWVAHTEGPTIQVGIAPSPGVRPCIVGWSGFDSCGLVKKLQTKNAKFIAAANPTKVIELLDAMDAQAQRIAELEAEVESTWWLSEKAEQENTSLRAELDALRGQEPCRGVNCGSTVANLHSAECFAAHEQTIGVAKPFGYFEYVLDENNGYWRESENGAGTPLYAAPVAPAQPAQDVNAELPPLPEPVELNPASNSVMGYHEAHLKAYARTALAKAAQQKGQS